MKFLFAPDHESELQVTEYRYRSVGIDTLIFAVVQEIFNANRLKIFANEFHQGIFTRFIPFTSTFVWCFARKTLCDGHHD